MSDPDISVVVGTRNRPGDILECVRCIAGNSAHYRELVVVDQSDGDEAERALGAVPPAAKLRCLRTSTRGVSQAKNIGISVCSGSLIAFTDDDCRVPPDWVESVVDVFAREADTDMIFGRVTVPDVQGGVAFGASFEPHRRHLHGAMPNVRAAWGIGANMAARRAILDRVGVFDPLLGPGSKFKAGEEVDLAIRVLAAGGRIANTPEVTVHHLGVRRGDEASQLMRGYLFATGAVYTKHLRLGTRGSIRLLTETVWMHVENTARNVFRGTRPTGLGQLIALGQGTFASLRCQLDSDRGVYRL